MLILPSVGLAQNSGNLDLSFGESGKLVVDIGQMDRLHGHILLEDGSILAFGQTADYDGTFDFDGMMFRVQENGEMVSEFGEDGILRFDFPGESDSRIIDATVFGSNIYIMGQAGTTEELDSQKIFIAQYDLEGNLNLDFGNDGFYSEPYFTAFVKAGAIEADSDGRLVYCATVVDTTAIHTWYPLVGRLTSEGERDSSFNEIGTIFWDEYGGFSSAMPVHDDESMTKHAALGASARDIHIMSDSYLISGVYMVGEINLGFTMKIGKDGVPDATYGYAGDGTLVEDLGTGYASEVINSYYKDGLYYIVGYSTNFDQEYRYHVRKHGHDGISVSDAIFDFHGNSGLMNESFMDGDQLYLGGYSKLPSSTDVGFETDFFGVCAIDTNLELETYFAEGGYSTERIYEEEESGCTGLSEYDQDRFIASGFTDVDDGANYHDAVLMRYWKLDESLSINQTEGLHLKVYPNPVNDQLTVEFEGKFDYKLLSLNGEVILNGSGNDIQSIPVRDLPSGVYMIHVRTQSASFIKKIIRN